MNSYVESVSLSVPMYGGEERAFVGASRPNRMKIVGGALAVLACAAMILSAFTAAPGESVEMTQKLVPKITPKFVDWKKEDAGSDDMNLHLQVADALAKADGLAEKNLSPVPEKLLKEAEQKVEKLAKEGDRKRDEAAKEAKEAKSKKAAVKKAAAKKVAASKAEKSASQKLLDQISQDAKSSPKAHATVAKK